MIDVTRSSCWMVVLMAASQLVACGDGPAERPGSESGGSGGIDAGHGGSSSGHAGSGGSGGTMGSGGTTGTGGATGTGGSGGTGGVGSGGVGCGCGVSGTGGAAGSTSTGGSAGSGGVRVDAGFDAGRDVNSAGSAGSSSPDAAVKPDVAATADTGAPFDARPDTSAARDATSNEAAGPQSYFLSDLPWVGTPVNFWGPVERDKSNNEQALDGNPITIHGVQYGKGLGCHADSRITYTLAGKCQTFAADVGLDDEQSCGSVRFRVILDGVTKFTSADIVAPKPVAVPPNPAAVRVSVDVTGGSTLEMVVDKLADTYCDHADWANATVVCTSSP
jgi:hypothetical protein